MNHLKFLICSVLFLYLFCDQQQTIAQERPNILWITIEDTSPQFIGAYGNTSAETPNIDKLARNGVRFTNAFSTATVCAASRSTIITGVRTYKMGTGHHRSNYPIPDFIKGFPYYLQKKGYYTTNNAKTDYNVGNVKEFTDLAWNESSGTAGWWNRDSDQPFFAVFNFVDSHQSRTMSWPYDRYKKQVLEKIPESERISETAFPMPPFYHDTPAMRKQFARVYNSIKRTDTKIGALLDRLDEDNLRENTIIFFYGDHGQGVPRGKGNGIDLGYRVPFMIWVPEKYQGLSPWGTGGVVTDELVSFEDLAPTVISLAGGDPPKHMKGRTLMGHRRDTPVDHLELSHGRAGDGVDLVRTITTGDYTYSRNFMPFTPEVRSQRFSDIGAINRQMRQDLATGKLNKLQKSLFEPRPAEYLFKIEDDIWQTHNMINDPKARPIVKRMRKQLKSDILQSRDVMFLPEYEIGKISKKTTPYEYRLNKEKYPIREIYKAASLSGRRGTDIAARQIKFLSSSNKIIRYWAAVGLRSQPSHILNSYRNPITEAMEDAYPPVEITASAIAYQQFDSQEAEATLKKYAQNDNKDLALMSIFYLNYIDDKRPFVDTIKSVLNLENRNYAVRAACLNFLGRVDLIPFDWEHLRSNKN